MVWARVDIRDTGERRGHRRSHTAGAGGDTKVTYCRDRGDTKVTYCRGRGGHKGHILQGQGGHKGHILQGQGGHKGQGETGVNEVREDFELDNNG